MSNNKCKTKFPIVFIHGAGFRDDKKYYNYWGRITKALEDHGTEVFYSNQDAWGTIESNSEIIKNSILDVLSKTNAEKVNLIAHSKGGLEARYVISKLEMGESIASLSTISTPHNGSKTIDILYKLPEFLYKIISKIVNLWFRILGDKSADFFNASRQLSSLYCSKFNKEVVDLDQVYYQSYACKMKNPLSDILFFFPNLIISIVEGENDGLVTVESAKWGEFRGIIKGNGFRGVSHADAVDLRRRNFSNVDIRETYIKIAENLVQRGL